MFSSGKKEVKSGKVGTTVELIETMKNILPKGIKNEDVYFVCIGTDRSTGDAIGPLVGLGLSKLGYTNLIGTLDNPVHAMNLEEIIENLPKRKTIIAIDACLGQSTSIGKMEFRNTPIQPGAGVKKNLPAVGDYSVSAIVNVGGFMEYFVLQNTRLSLVMSLADKIIEAIEHVLPLESVKEA